MNETLLKISAEIKSAFIKKLESPEMKSFMDSVKAAEDKDSGTFEVVISSEIIDRMGEVVKIDGMDLTNYMLNPVVLWGHDHYAMPIGICTSIEKREGKAFAKGKFAPESANPIAQQVRQLYDLGIQRATSIGFMEIEREGNLITKSELLEFSFVSVPANPMALSTLVKSNISVNDMVTKGFISVKEEEPAPEPTPTPEPTPEPTEKFIGTKEVKDAVEALKTAISSAFIALEDLVNKSQEPERKEPEDDQEVKAFKDFSTKRKLLQDASTIIGEVLAEARQSIEARKK